MELVTAEHPLSLIDDNCCERLRSQATHMYAKSKDNDDTFHRSSNTGYTSGIGGAIYCYIHKVQVPWLHNLSRRNLN